MSIPITVKLAAAALGVMLVGLTWITTAAPAPEPSKHQRVPIAARISPPTMRRVDPALMRFIAHDSDSGSLFRVHAAAADHDADELRHEHDYLEKKAKAYYMLRDVELERAKSATDPLTRKEARAKAQIHEAEAEKLAREAKQLQAKLAKSTTHIRLGPDDRLTPGAPLKLSPGFTINDYLLGLSGVEMEPAPCCRRNNLAYGRSVTASSQEEIINNFAQLAVDGDLSTRWCAEDDGVGEWLQVDLGAVRNVSQIRIHWEMMNTKYSYRIETSADGKNWRTAVDTSQDPKRAHMPQHDLDVPQTRYLRITFLGSDAGYWASIREIEVAQDELSPPPAEAWEKVRPDAEPPFVY